MGSGVIEQSSDLVTLEERDKILVKDLGKLVRVLYPTKLWLKIESHSCGISNIMARSVHHRVRWWPIDTLVGVFPSTGPSHIIADTSTLSVSIHFVERGLEIVFVHRFSNATMLVRNIFKNSFHYWVFFGALLVWAFYEHITGRRSSQPVHSHRVTSPETESNR